jgi:hypothetical protein
MITVRTRRRQLPSAALAAAAGIVVAVAAVVITITVTRSPGSGVLSNGSPPGGAAYAGIAVRPGQLADFAVTVENSGSQPVTLERASLVPLDGFRAPQLARIGVLAEHSNLLVAARNWPIPRGNTPSAGYYRMHALAGYVVLPGRTRQARKRKLGPLPDIVEYAVLGRSPDTDYISAGLKITYRLQGATYTQTLYSGGDACVLATNLARAAQRQALYNRYCARMWTNGPFRH